MNSVNIIGNITRDIELKYAASGLPIANFGVAVNKKVKNQQTQAYEEKPVFIDVTGFGKTAETINQYFRKGSKIGIEGELNFEQWTAQDGQKRSKLTVTANRITFIDKKDQAAAPQAAYGAPQAAQPAYGQPPAQPAPQPPQPAAAYAPPQPAYAPPAQPAAAPRPAAAPPAQPAYAPPPPAQPAYAPPPAAAPQPGAYAPPAAAPQVEINEDEIPF